MWANLDLQLMIAAPEVARAEGNTTYRLVRHVTADGREEVIVSGRRGVMAADEVADESLPTTTDDESEPPDDAAPLEIADADPALT